MVPPNSFRHETEASGLRAWISKTPYYKLRHRAFLLFTVFALILPFIKINGNQVFLLSFLHLEFHLFGVSYDMQELYLIPLILILAFVFVFLATSLGGRMWCGWGCPQTMFRTLYRDFIQEKLLGLRKFHLKTRPLKLQKWPERFKFLLGILLLTPLMFAASANILWFFVAPQEFFYLLLNHPQEHTFLFAFWVLLALFLIIDISWFGENFCHYVCPYARIQTVLFDEDTPVAIYDKARGDNTDGSRSNRNKKGVVDSSGDCTGCLACVRICPAKIDIRDGLQLACIACLECSDACAPVMQRLAKKNLISWTSEKVLAGFKLNLLRPRVWYYATIIVIISAILFYSGGNRETLLLNINRTTQLYKLKDEGKSVENHYVLLLTNIDDKAHTFSIETKNLNGLTIKRPRRPFLIKAGGRVRKVLIISTSKLLVNNSAGNTSLDFIIRAFATDDPENIFSEHSSFFMFPAAGEVRMKP